MNGCYLLHVNEKHLYFFFILLEKLKLETGKIRL